ncbi:hypothetical protein BJ508DRAFT_240617 [Ascobolus immersus RN42]|uniref:NADH:ubiquinone oxidoreductase intermediate-associated protein 30 domain-containing protein n=1 Tax=Ascobolus immersus RN42 TaxID=1160509 RepID=A0A3N4I211_ASCIM|nr:hypothetical protein BJ508DRAFT_240617 [Ascobolus immersus RN42]
MKIVKLVPFLFPWVSTDWTPQTDQLRGGVSFSGLDIAEGGGQAIFYGQLNTTILDAGFSAQRTTGGQRSYDWSQYKGLQFEYKSYECRYVDKIFTLIIKDRLQQGDDGPPPTNPNPDPALPPGPDTISFEYHFLPECDPKNPNKLFKVQPKFDEFLPEYRGSKVKTNERPQLKTVRRFSFMVRSFDSTQQLREQDGRYAMLVKKISLWK